jgi:hypothetical protein
MLPGRHHSQRHWPLTRHCLVGGGRGEKGLQLGGCSMLCVSKCAKQEGLSHSQHNPLSATAHTYIPVTLLGTP